MSSGTNVNMAAAKGMLGQLPAGDQGGPVGPLSPRQAMLDMYWRYFRCANYDGYKYDWNGQENVGPVEHDLIAAQGVLPPGFVDAGQSLSDMPLKFRRPSAPYYLAKVIVGRFTGLLFSKRRHPKISCDDPETEQWLTGFAEATRLWAAMIQARNFGGAMGSVALGLKFIRGAPVVEVFDPRWCTPSFVSRDANAEVEQLEIRYQFNEEVRTSDGWETRWFWFRRVIDETNDTTWPKVSTEHGEPDWERERKITKPHGLDFCPVVWIQNQPVQDDIDGDPDCHGAYDFISRIDGLYSQADKATIANCDPTTVIKSAAEFWEIRKGSGNALQVAPGDEISYLEMTGAGIERAVSLADKFEEKALTVARCVLDNQQTKSTAGESGGTKTATEVEHDYSSMWEQADTLREQYGEHGIKRLLTMALRAGRLMGTPVKGMREDGLPALMKFVIKLPKRRMEDPDTGEVTWVERTIGQGEQIELNWPDYATKSDQAISAKVDAAVKAKVGGLIDQKHASQYVAEAFQVENVPDMIAKIQAEGPQSFGGGGYAPPGGYAPSADERTQFEE